MKTLLKDILDYAILTFFMLIFITVRIYRSVNPNRTLVTFKAWYQKQSETDVWIGLLIWALITIGAFIGWFWVLMFFIAVGVANMAGLFVWYWKLWKSKK